MNFLVEITLNNNNYKDLIENSVNKLKDLL